MKADIQSMSIVARKLSNQMRHHEIRSMALTHDDGLTFMLEKDEINAIQKIIADKISALQLSLNELTADINDESIL